MQSKQNKNKNRDKKDRFSVRSVADFFLGVVRIEIKKEDAEGLFNVLLSCGVRYRNFSVSEGEGQECASVEMSVLDAKAVLSICKIHGINTKSRLIFGLPRILGFLIHRPFALLGLAIAVALVCISRTVLWEISINGNAILSDGEVLDVLEENGLYLGVPLKNIDVDLIQTEIARHSESIAWISVNIRGTVAEVELVEVQAPRPIEECEGDGVNLVASRDGLISGFELIAGEAVVESGQTVKAGELLASGLVDSGRYGFRALKAKGKVFAQTERIVEVFVPYDYTVIVPESRPVREISIIFFSFRQKIFKKGGNEVAKCDTINSEFYIYSSNERKIPIGIEITRELVSSQREERRTKQMAESLAYFELSRIIDSECAECEILRKNTHTHESDDGRGVVLVCTLVCIEDIAKPSPFFVSSGE